MAKVKQIAVAAGTFSVALGIGFVMQNGDALANRFGGEDSPAQPAPFTQDASLQVGEDTTGIEQTDTAVPLLTAQSGVLSSAAPRVVAPEPESSAAVILPDAARVAPQSEPPVHLATLDADTPLAVPATGDEPDFTATEIDCTPEMNLTEAAAATIAVAVSAPCHLDTSFTLHHQGMMFTVATDAEGAADLNVPALAQDAVLIAAFADGNGAVASLHVPDFANYDRAVLQWQGETSVMLSAYEGNANFGDSNHIHAGNPGNITRIEASEGGYLVRLGNSDLEDALIAEVYTFPSGMMGDGPDVMLVAEAEITAANCGKELSAQSIQISPTGENSALDLRMTMPECDAVGDFLVLQNMFRDLTLASR